MSIKNEHLIMFYPVLVICQQEIKYANCIKINIFQLADYQGKYKTLEIRKQFDKLIKETVIYWMV